MKKIGLILLAVVMVAGMAGCGGDSFSPNLSNMAGVYNLTKVTVTSGGSTAIVVPPAIVGTITLSSLGTYSLDVFIYGDRTKASGIYAISGDDIIITGEGSGPITDDGRMFSFTVFEGGTSVIFEFSRV